ncbi:MAG TPA: hypothetical protein VJS44_21185 [Pyrinomonadaceae bacterium]|nr:hypothetical protein [Pyrinomonadaceae bacterium]
MQLRFISALLIAAALLLSTVGAVEQSALAQTRGASGIGHAKMRVGRTRITFPRLTRYRDARVMREVNRQIAEATKDFAVGCTGKNKYFTVRSKVAYADRDIFSIYASSQYWCGGPYPTNDDNISQTFDLRTGKLVAFSELFRNYEADRQEILRTIFGARIEAGERVKASGKEDDNCDGPYAMDQLEGTTFNYNFSATGLQIQPSWPHVIEACADIVTVPYSKLQRFAAPDGILARMK